MRFRAAVCAVFVALILAGCAAAAPPSIEQLPISASASEPTPAPTSPPIGVRVGNTAPDLALLDLAGQEVSLSEYRGRPVMLNFWAVWCGFCRVELPEMQAVYEEHQDRGFVILAIDVQEEQSVVQPFADELGLTFPVLLDGKGEVTRSYQVRGLPTSYFVDQNGVIVGVQVGPVDRLWMIKYLAQVGVD